MMMAEHTCPLPAIGALPSVRFCDAFAGEDVKSFSEIKQGDEIVVRHTEALAINVEPTK
jgi:hypothetical protein